MCYLILIKFSKIVLKINVCVCLDIQKENWEEGGVEKRVHKIQRKHPSPQGSKMKMESPFSIILTQELESIQITVIFSQTFSAEVSQAEPSGNRSLSLSGRSETDQLLISFLQRHLSMGSVSMMAITLSHMWQCKILSSGEEKSGIAGNEKRVIL